MAAKQENKVFYMEVGNRVRTVRENLGLTRKELAGRIGLSEYFLVSIENGRKGISIATLRKLSNALCTPAEFLLTGRESPSDVTSITAMLSTMEPRVVKGAERILKAYLLAIRGI